MGNLGEGGVLGTLAAGALGLIIALTRGWLLTPHHVEVWQSRYQEMLADRNYWRDHAHSLQRQIDEALRLKAERIEQ